MRFRIRAGNELFRGLVQLYLNASRWPWKHGTPGNPQMRRFTFESPAGRYYAVHAPTKSEARAKLKSFFGLTTSRGWRFAGILE